MRLERENCGQATPVLYPSEVTLCDCLLISFALHFCKPISDAKGKERSSDFDLVKKKDQEQLFVLNKLNEQEVVSGKIKSHNSKRHQQYDLKTSNK